MRPTEELKDEHRVIERMLRVLSRACDRLDQDDDVDPKVFTEAVDFFQTFADRCHHTKEEKLLFEKMMERGVSGEVGPIAVMMREHQDGRAHVRKLSGLTKDGFDPSKRKAVVRTSRAYVDLLSKHIQKEDSVLYPMADQVLDNNDQEELQKGFEDVEKEIMGPGVHEKYHRMIEELEAKLT